MSATFGNHIDKRYTSLELIGGKYCDIGNNNTRPDLIVHGGAHIGATSCFDALVYIKQDLTIEGNITVLQNTYLSNIYSAETITDAVITDHVITDNIIVPLTSSCLDIQGNVCVSGTLNYVAGNAAVWSTPPSSLQGALDRLAEQVYVLLGNIPIP